MTLEGPINQAWTLGIFLQTIQSSVWMTILIPFGYRVRTPLAGGSTGLRWQCLNYLAGVWKFQKGFSVESCRLWAIIRTIWRRKREKRSEEKVSDVRVHGCSRSTHIYGFTRYIRRCMHSTRSLYWATYRNVPWCLLVEAYFFRASATIRRSTSNLFRVACLYVRVTT